MREASAPSGDRASERRRRWSTPRIAAAVLLHALVLTALTLAIDRAELPRRDNDRVTTLVSVALHAAPPPVHALPLPGTQPRASAYATGRARGAATRPPAREDTSQAITLPAPPKPWAVAPIDSEHHENMNKTLLLALTLSSVAA